ncbi:MAG: four-carbon acid sugar kinase family protein [Pseudanabaenaceae cyanobacterium SKYGB_i_bin29]|nr:four-carbon acid sugar kinase family protein [Pseudanabaenaceae cyanobacterium SKYG29]MDW8421929.1 four-carbon acid sugar kinase family protein [Pseudanabaenaceae cyanobacterium SKYGB_i_bin29]
MVRPLVIVLDDDPTGCQTVHSCLLLTQWDKETLRLGVKDNSPLFFVLTNTRAVPPDRAAAITRSVCQNLREVLREEGVERFLIVSRSDSTLRGHYPIETDVIAAELGTFDAHFLVPAFFEGGRFTENSVHYLMVDGVPTPTHLTEFAKDSVFGYSTSYLPAYVEEKTKGRIKAEQVVRFLLEDVRAGLQDKLRQLQGNVCVVVDAKEQSDLDRFAQDVLTVSAEGKRFLFRSAASLLTALAQLPPQPIAPEEMGRHVNSTGVILVGSHVKKTTTQLAALLELNSVQPIPVQVERLLHNEFASLQQEVLEKVQTSLQQGLTPVIFTSRQEITFTDLAARLAFGERVSDLLMAIVANLPPGIGFLISKGGITSNDVLSKGLALRAVRLLGQILPGVSVVRTDSHHPRFPNLPVVLFPGNVGDRDSLVTVYQRLSGRSDPPNSQDRETPGQ